MEEIWKDVPEYEGLYKVSNIGRVKSLIGWNGNATYKRELILKHYKQKSGYLAVSLSKNKKRKLFRIHRIVAIAFIKKVQNKPQVNHINEIKTDNRVENLEWCNHIENMNHGTKNKRQSETLKKRNLKGDFATTAKPKEYYAKKCVTRHHFKKICKSRNWKYSDFEEVFTGERYFSKSSKSTNKKFLYIPKTHKRQIEEIKEELEKMGKL